MTGNSLINLGELSKPATVLVEKISGAIGVLYEPRRIRSIAQAEADAERIRAQADIEVSDLQRRAVQRWFNEEGIKQENIETITSKALPEVSADAEPERIENDWIINFFDKARLISDEEMQTLWARVLSGEATRPGTYSKRTVNYLASLDAEDARLLGILARFCWKDEEFYPMIFDVDLPIYTSSGLTFAVLTHLDDIGLVRFDTEGYTLAYRTEEARLSYFGETVNVTFSDEDRALPTGHVFLSKMGEELIPLCQTSPVKGYFYYVLRHWIREDLILSSPYPRLTNTD
jgi:hypothetical protein